MPETKRDLLAALRERCRALVREVYASDGKVVVFGEGDPDAPLMLVGEAPGEQETLQGHPFVGKAGKNLDGFLEALGIAREGLYITNVVKFRPVKEHRRTGTLSNRPPNREEIALCYSFLLGEVSIVRPQVVVTLGNVALKAMGDDSKLVIGECHGQPRDVAVHNVGFTLFPLYHPASVIYNRSLAEVYRQDLSRLRAHLDQKGILPRQP